MEITGIQTQTVTIDVDAADCLKVVARTLGVGQMLFPDERDCLRYIETRDKEGTLIAIMCEEDISYCRGTCWKQFGEPIADVDVLAAYEAVKVLKELIQKKQSTRM